VECFLSEASPLRVRLQGCVDASLCEEEDAAADTSSVPAAAPTPHSNSTGTRVERAGLHLVAPYVVPNIAYKEIVVGRTNALPKEGVEGALFLHAPCEFTEEDGWYMGKIALFDRTLETMGSTSSCNVYEALRLLGQKNVHGALIVDEDEGLDKIQATWLGRDMNIGCFCLGIRQESANTFRTLLRRNATGVSLRLKGPANTCDTAHVSGVVVGVVGSTEEAEVASCCAASDMVLSKIAYDFDYWELGVRLSPFCPAGTGAVPSSCARVTDALEEEEEGVPTTLCRVDAKVNGVCEDGGPNATAARVGYGMDCGDCGVRVLDAHSTHGYPTHAAYEAAHRFLCERRKACGETVAERYQEYFGDDNFFANRLRSLCSETTCSVPG
jgi:hypothetical protein